METKISIKERELVSYLISPEKGNERRKPARDSLIPSQQSQKPNQLFNLIRRRINHSCPRLGRFGLVGDEQLFSLSFFLFTPRNTKLSQRQLTVTLSTIAFAIVFLVVAGV